MGADLILTSLPACTITPERREKLLSIADAMPDSEFGGDVYGTPKEQRENLLASIEELGDMDSHRLVCSVQFEGMPHRMWITGGPSWGDMPTEIGQPMRDLAECVNIYNQLREWAIKDAAAHRLRLAEIRKQIRTEACSRRSRKR